MLREVNPSSEEERSARAYVLDLRGRAGNITSHESFCEMYELLYSVLKKLGPECQDFAKKSQEQFQQLTGRYNNIQESNNQDEIESYRQETREFADELGEKVLEELCPLGELEHTIKNRRRKKR